MNRLIFAALGVVLATGAQGQCDPKTGLGCAATVQSVTIVGAQPYCDPGWTLVPVATSSGTKQMCAAVGDLKEPK